MGWGFIMGRKSFSIEGWIEIKDTKDPIENKKKLSKVTEKKYFCNNFNFDGVFMHYSGLTMVTKEDSR